MLKCNFNKVAKSYNLYWNHASVWVSPVNFCIFSEHFFPGRLLEGFFCIFHTCWVSTAVLIVKNDVFLLVPTEVLELGFSNAFNKSLIKCGKIVSCLMQYSKKFGNDQKPRCSSCIVTETTIRKFCHLSYMVITLHNLMILLCRLLHSHPKILNFYQHATWNTKRFSIPI